MGQWEEARDLRGPEQSEAGQLEQRVVAVVG
jgi:hypothetical protein